MSRRPARITQADIARAIRAAKQTGAVEIEVRIKDKVTIIYRLVDTPADPLAETQEITL
jgi:hypothetical protein